MIALDANILLYAYNSAAPQHPVAKAWLERLFAGREPIGLPWPSLWAFLRISTNSRVFPNPIPVQEACATIRTLLAQPGVIALGAGPLHLDLLEQLAVRNGAVGPLVSDAVLAAIAMENGATLATTDGDFRRFTGLSTVDPLQDSPRSV